MFRETATVAAWLSGEPSTRRRRGGAEGGHPREDRPDRRAFLGAVRVQRNPADMSGRIVGIGDDQRSPSSTQGEIRYRRVPLGQGTRVDPSIRETLTGDAGAGRRRPGLVRHLAARLIAQFAGNFYRRLSGTPADVAPAELNGMALVFGSLRAQVARWLGLRGRSDEVWTAVGSTA